MILVNINYKVSFETILESVQDHRGFLSRLYEKKYIALSGPKTSKKGGIILVCSKDVEKAKSIFSEDPFLVKNLADYEYIPFDAVKYLSEVESIIKYCDNK